MRRPHRLRIFAAVVIMVLGAPAHASADSAADEAPVPPLLAIPIASPASHGAVKPRRPSTAGLVILGTGAALFIVGDLMSDVCIGFDVARLFDKEPPPRLVTQMVPPGLTMVGVGLVGVVAGAILVLRTDPSLAPSAVTPPAVQLALERDSWVREPVWGEGAPDAKLRHAFEATVVSGTF
jgi:hypothetical protein